MQDPPKIEDNPAVVDTALSKVRKYFELGKTRSYQFRVAQLNALKKGVTELTKDFDEALTKDLGKGTFENWLCELMMVTREINHALESLKHWMRDEPRDTPFIIGPGESYLAREPLGVVAILGSWNYPLVTTLSPLVSAISAGNAVIFKPSEFSPYTSVVLKRLFARYLDSAAY
jgi:aldehyde dehydrogenase (NAD+)